MSTPKTTPTPAKTPTRTKRRAQITPQDLKAIAKLVARRLTETEACEVAGLNPETWTKWKNRHGHDARFVRILTRVRATYIKNNLEQMEKAATGAQGIRHDWRAADRLNQIVKPDVYGLQAPAPALPQPSISVNTVNLWLQEAHAQIAREAAGQVVDAQEVKALPAPPLEAIRDEWTDTVMRASSQEKLAVERRISAGVTPPRPGRMPPVMAEPTQTDTKGN